MPPTRCWQRPAAEAAAWIYSWIWVPGLGFIVFLPLLFPSGRLSSPRWRPFAWFSLLGCAAASRERGRAPADQMGSLCRRTGGRRLSSHLDRLGSGGTTMASHGWIRACVGWNRGSPDGSGHGDNTLQALGDRHPHKPHPRLRIAHGDTGSSLLRCRRSAAAVLRRPHRREVHARGGGLHSLDRRSVHHSRFEWRT